MIFDAAAPNIVNVAHYSTFLEALLSVAINVIILIAPIWVVLRSMGLFFRVLTEGSKMVEAVKEAPEVRAARNTNRLLFAGKLEGRTAADWAPGSPDAALAFTPPPGPKQFRLHGNELCEVVGVGKDGVTLKTPAGKLVHVWNEEREPLPGPVDQSPVSSDLGRFARALNLHAAEPRIHREGERLIAAFAGMRKVEPHGRRAERLAERVGEDLARMLEILPPGVEPPIEVLDGLRAGADDAETLPREPVAKRVEQARIIGKVHRDDRTPLHGL